jgi:hypothetical protein
MEETKMARRHFPQGVSDSAICAFDDPVPPGSKVAAVAPEHCAVAPHRIEREVQRRLASLPGTQILTLAVHRIDGGVCLEGTLETDRPCPDLRQVLREIEGVEKVVDRLRIRQVDRLAAPLSADDDTVWL